MSRILFLAVPALLLAACEQQAPRGADVDTLDSAVSAAIGDPNTCVRLVKKSGEVVYRYGTREACSRALPSCQGDATLTGEDFAKLAAAGDSRKISCDAGPNGESRVAWASGPAPKSPGATHEDLAYAALMEGPTVPPGREIAIRLEEALVKGGM